MPQWSPPNLARNKSPKPVLLPMAIGHHTPAVRTLFARAVGAAVKTVTKRHRKRKVKAAGTTTTKRCRHRKSTATKAHMVKGSTAAKKHMASLRKMRKKAA